MNADQKRALSLAQEVLNKMTEDYTPTDDWSAADWKIFQAASIADDQIRLRNSLPTDHATEDC